MKKLIILLILLPFFCCSQKKEYNIKDLNILHYDSSNNYVKTISEAGFFLFMNTPQRNIPGVLSHKTALLDLTHHLGQFGSLKIESFNDLKSYYLDIPKFIFVEKSNNYPVTGDIFFEVNDWHEFLFEKKKNIIGFVEHGQMDGEWEIPIQKITLSLERDFLPPTSQSWVNSSFGLITVNYKNGIRHGKTLVSDEQDKIYYTCNYVNGQLDGYEELDLISPECIYYSFTNNRGWSLNKTISWTHPCSISGFPKQINKYNQGKLVAMKLWMYDLPEMDKCLKDYDQKVKKNPNKYFKNTPINLEEIKVVQKAVIKKYEFFEDCIKAELIFDWNDKSEEKLEFLIMEVLIKIKKKIE